jgi:outer membrane protein assembly factor BamB
MRYVYNCSRACVRRAPFVLTIITVAVAALSSAGSAYAQIRSTAGGGPWNGGSTWAGGVVPGPADDVVIVSGAEVALTSSQECARLTVESGAALSGTSSVLLTVSGPVTNDGSVVGESTFVETRGNVTNRGVWTMKLHYGGTGARTVLTRGVEGDQWVVGDVILEGENEMARLDAITDQTGQLLVQEGASLRFTVAPEINYKPAALSLPDDPKLQNRGLISVPSIPVQFNNVVLGSDMIGAFGVTAVDTIWAETYGDQVHPAFPGSIAQWFRFGWKGTGDPVRPSFQTLALGFDGSQLNGLDPANLFVYHLPDGGSTWTRVTTLSFQVIYDPSSGDGLTSLANVSSTGDYVIAGPNGPSNRPPVAVEDIEFTMRSQSVLVNVLANDSDPDGDAIELFSATDGSFGSTTIEAGQIRYTPTGTSTGDDTFTYVITDEGGREASATVTVRIADPAIALFTEGGAGEPGGSAEVVRQRVTTLNFDYLDVLAASENSALALNLFDDETVVLDQIGSKRWGTTEVSWFGESDRVGDWITLEYDTASRYAFATAWAEGIPYRIERQSDGSYLIQALDLSGLSDDGDNVLDSDTSLADRDISVLESWEIEGASGGESAGKNMMPEIDLLILFTTQARNVADASTANPSTTKIRQEIINAVNNTNQTFRNSGVNAVVRLAGTAMVQYDEADKAQKDLNNLTNAGQNSDSDVALLREQYGADIVGLVSSNIPDACGIANLMTSVNTNHGNKAYFVVQRGNCLGNNLSFAHEIGHVMGARHDRFVDDKDGSPYDYNHGYVNPIANWTPLDTSFGPNQWRTVMAYNDACDCTDEVGCPKPEDRSTSGPSCTRLMWWSNPVNTWTNGSVMGIASGSNAANNVRTLNNTASTVAAFRGGLPAVSGFVTDSRSGDAIVGVRLEGITPTQGYSAFTDSAGYYAMLVPAGSQLVVTPDQNVVSLDASGNPVDTVRYAFVPPFADFGTLTSDVARDFTATPLFTVSGIVRLNGTGLPLVEIRGATGQTPLTDLQGEYSMELPWDWPGTLTPIHPAYDFTPASVSFDTLRTDVEVNFVARLKRHTISGSISTLIGTGIADVVLEGLPGDPQTDGNGTYSVIVDHGWSGSVRPLKPGFSFEPLSREYVSVSQDLTHDYDAYPGGLARSEWPMSGSSPLHRGRVDIATFSNQVQWSATVDGSIIPPVVGQDGTVFIPTSSRLYAVSKTGDRLWDIVLPNGGDVSPALGTAGRVYMPSGGVLIAYDAFDQSQDWGYFTGDRIYSSPAIDEEGNVYVGSDSDSLFAISPDGVRLWAFGTGGDVRSSPAITPEGNLVFGSDDGNVYAVDSNGIELWRFPTGGPVRSSPTIANSGNILVGTDADAIFAIDTAAGSQIWRFATGGDVRGTPAVDTEGNVYVGSSDSTLYALTPSGSLDWSFDAPGPISGSAAISYTRVRRLSELTSDEEVVYFSTDNNVTYALNIRTPSGITDRMRWLYPGMSTSPVLTSAGLVIGNQQSISNLVALEPESRALTQLSVLLNDFGGNFDPDLIAAILWLEQPGGPLALLPDLSGDPCTGGSLIIPDCEFTGQFDPTNPLAVVLAGRDLILGIAQWSQFFADLIAGTSTEGLLGTFPIRFDPDAVSAVVVGGLVDPTGYAPNPDGLSTDLGVFQTEFSRETLSDPESVYLVSGNFSTDASTLNFSLSGNETFDFSGLNFGSLSDIVAVPEGIYDVALLGSASGKSGGQLLQQSMLDLTDRAGEIVALYATGFIDPSANNGGPPIGILAAAGSGDVLIGSSVAKQDTELPKALSIEALFPNPFSGIATVSYDVPRPQRVRIELFDILGRKVRVLVDDEHEAGTRKLSLDSSGLSSGVYLLRLASDQGVVTRKLTVVQ